MWVVVGWWWVVGGGQSLYFLLRWGGSYAHSALFAGSEAVALRGGSLSGVCCSGTTVKPNTTPCPQENLNKVKILTENLNEVKILWAQTSSPRPFSGHPQSK